MSARDKLVSKEIKDKRTKAKEDAEAYESRVRKALNRTFSTPDGIKALNYLAHELGFYSNSINMIKNGDILPIRTAYNEARRNVYLELRNKLDRDIVIQAESLKGDLTNVEN